MENNQNNQNNNPYNNQNNNPYDNQYNNQPSNGYSPGPAPMPSNTKFCQFCGKTIDKEAVLCVNCGRQVEKLATQSQGQPIIINNTNTNTNTNGYGGPGANPKNKWVAALLCFFLGYLGAHKFYEGKILLGIIYLLTVGLFGIGILVDFIVLLCKPNPYYV